MAKVTPMGRKIKSDPLAGRKPKLTLEVSDPQVGDDGVECVASLDVLDEDGEGIDDIKVQFYLDREHCGRPKTTSSDGRAAKKFTCLNPGKHVFEARLVAKPKFGKRVEKEVKEDTSRLSSPRVEIIGNKLMVTLVTESGKAAPNRRILVYNLYPSKPGPVEKRTDSGGVFITKNAIDVSTKRNIKVTIPGTDHVCGVQIPVPSVFKTELADGRVDLSTERFRPTLWDQLKAAYRGERKGVS